MLVLAGYLVTTAFLSPSNPTIAAMHATARYDYIDPIWMISTLAVFPVLAALWFLLVAPGIENAGLRWRILQPAVIVMAIIGLWFAANGTSLLTSLFARHSAPHVLALALALALSGPALQWLDRARRPLMLYAAIVAVAAVSYNIDLVLFGRFVDRHLAAGLTDIDKLPPAEVAAGRASESPVDATHLSSNGQQGRTTCATSSCPTTALQRMSLAFYSFFRSDRNAVLFHPLAGQANGRPSNVRPPSARCAAPATISTAVPEIHPRELLRSLISSAAQQQQATRPRSPNPSARWAERRDPAAPRCGRPAR